MSNFLEAGRMIGRYRIVDFLGAGAMGEVYLAEDPQIERRLAVKTVRLAGPLQEVDHRKKHLLREARAAGRLLHPNVVTLFDAGEDKGLLFLAFEFIEGSNLASRQKNGPALSLREVLRIIRQTAEALEYAHHVGRIVHCDIKPSNILLDVTGQVKVADFGIAKIAGLSTELLGAGLVMGSPQYLSPEQIRGEDLDGRSDIFSLGVVLYELLSRKRPFDGETITSLIHQIIHIEPPPVWELRDLPQCLKQLLQRMLAKDREERFASAAAVAFEVAKVERELSEEMLSAPAAALPSLEATRQLPRIQPGTLPNGQPRSASEKLPEVFISYAWGDETSEGKIRAQIVDELYAALEADGFHPVRDHLQMQPGDRISTFVHRLTRADLIVAVISDKYLRSPYCMSEIHGLWQKSQEDDDLLAERLVPIILPEVKIERLRDRAPYVRYWREQKVELEDLLRELGSDLAPGSLRELRLVRNFAQDVDGILVFLQDVLMPRKLEAHLDDGFQAVRKALRRRMKVGR